MVPNHDTASKRGWIVLGQANLLSGCRKKKMWSSDKKRILQRLVKTLKQILAPYLAMSKKKWSAGIDIRSLSGEEWLRLLTGETNIAAFVGWCESCRLGQPYKDRCPACGAALSKLDEKFWTQIGSTIRRALQKDRKLLSRVKSERESIYGAKLKPIFPPQLEWLLKLWEQAPAPQHQAFAPKVHYQVANWVESLERLGLTKEEIIEVLSKDDFRNGQFERNGKDYAGIPGEDLRRLGEEFRRAVGFIPGSATDLSELWRTRRWVARQRTVPMARLKGERVRKRKSTED